MPIHVVSGSDHAETALSLGAVGYMLKPVKRQELAEVLKKLEANLSHRRGIAARYSAAFSDVAEITPPAVRADANPAWHLYPIRLNLEKLTADRRQVFRALRAENIGVNVHYIPVHRHPYYRDRFGYRGDEYPIAENAYERLISLPMFHSMSDQDVDDVIMAVKKIAAAFAV